MVRYPLLMGLKIQYCYDVSSPQIDPQIQDNLSQNPSRLLCRNWQTGSKIYVEMEST